MSRSHERAYRLLAERMQLGASARRVLYATFAALIGSGAWWLGVHYAETSDDLSRVAQESLALKVHGATAFVALLALGAMLAHHARRGWVLRRNRSSGSTVVAAFALLIVTGYALYYLVSDNTHAPVSVVHWVLGLALMPLLVGHIILGRRSRGTGLDGGVEPRHAGHR